MSYFSETEAAIAFAIRVPVNLPPDAHDAGEAVPYDKNLMRHFVPNSLLVTLFSGSFTSCGQASASKSLHRGPVSTL
jgi:hypothetical protein